jgi:hypothetical protein
MASRPTAGSGRLYGAKSVPLLCHTGEIDSDICCLFLVSRHAFNRLNCLSVCRQCIDCRGRSSCEKRVTVVAFRAERLVVSSVDYGPIKAVNDMIVAY